MIPKNIIQTWKTSDIPEPFATWSKQIQQEHPDFNYLFFDDSQVDKFIEVNYPQYHDYFKSITSRIVQIDFFRYVAVLHYGGFYMDLDMELVGKLNQLCEIDSNFIVSVEKENGDQVLQRLGTTKLLGNFMFAAEKGSPFLQKLIDVIVSDEMFKNMTPSELSSVCDFSKTFYFAGPVVLTYTWHVYPELGVRVFDLPKGFHDYAYHRYAGTWKAEWRNKLIQQVKK